MSSNTSHLNGKNFQTIDVKANIKILLIEVNTLRNDKSFNQKHEKKVRHWDKQLKSFLDKISIIEEKVIPLIKRDLEDSISDNLIITALLQPSLKNVFDEIKTHFKTKTEIGISEEMLEKLVAGPDTAKNLAWIGDTAIRYAILKRIWKPGLTTKDLHNKRMELETNENLSILCDKWVLFENRIHFDPDVPKDKKLSKIKGTLVEAIFGVIFIEKGYDKVTSAVSLIDRSV